MPRTIAFKVALRFAALHLGTMLLCSAAVLADERPNVIVILTDDQGWGDLRMNGNTNLATPNIDSIARDGASFDRFYVCPVCSPTRAEFLTGRYHPRSGVYSTSAGGERMDLDEVTIADSFQQAGYRTAAFGKWHNGMQYPYHPNGRGFDLFYGFCSGHWGDYFSPPLERNGELVRGNGFLIDDFTDQALDFIEANQDQPFFAYLPYNTPHSPMQVPDKWWDKFAEMDLGLRHRDPEKENVPHTRAALAMCENIDWNVGRILKKLDELQIAEKTIILYFCDNGPNGSRWNGGMKGRKGSTDEGGVRSPMVIRWPGKIAGGKTVTELGAAIDLHPTLADMAGIEVASEKPLDGISLKPLLLGTPTEWNDRMIFSHWRNRVSVRTRRFRFGHQGQLFDIREDPGQRTNVAQAHPQQVVKFREAVASWRDEVLADYPNDQRAFVIGHPDVQFTQIPARDGIAHGNIERSNRFPNCSFFGNWKSVDDKITWDVEVAEEGEFEVDLYYACPEADLGSVVELSFHNSRVTREIDVVNDVPLRGAENDRVKRIESYVKDFKPVRMGTIKLPAGKGQLTLKALKIPGSEGPEVRLLMLKRV